MMKMATMTLLLLLMMMMDDDDDNDDDNDGDDDDDWHELLRLRWSEAGYWAENSHVSYTSDSSFLIAFLLLLLLLLINLNLRGTRCLKLTQSSMLRLQ